MASCRQFLIIGIALLLFSCVQPINLEGFVDNMPAPPMGLGIEFEVSDESPKLQLSFDEEGVWWTALERGGVVPIESPKIIQVMDPRYFDSIAWYCESPAALTENQGVKRTTNPNQEWLVITPGTAPFQWAKTYALIVVGKKGEKQYGTKVSITVVGNSP